MVSWLKDPSGRTLWVLAAATAALLVVAVAYTRSSDTGTARYYSSDATSACLSGKGMKVDADRGNVDMIAQGAAEGAYRATVGENEVVVSFHRNADDAQDSEAAYKMFNQSFGGSEGSEKTGRRANVVFSWSYTPNDDEQSLADACFR